MTSPPPPPPPPLKQRPRERSGRAWRVILFTLSLLVAFSLLIYALYAKGLLDAAELPPARIDTVVDGASDVLTDFIDPATGCTYLVHRLGGVTPRLDGAGRPLCRGRFSGGGR